MAIANDTRVNVINIGLMLISCIAAFVLPFELFLFAYAVLGPLHYLTEISWLHDRQYFAKGKYDFVVLLLIGVLMSVVAAARDLDFGKDFIAWYYKNNLGGKLTTLALFGAVIMAFVKNHLIKIVSLLLVFVFVNGWYMPNAYTSDGEPFLKETKTMFVLSSLVPTLIHVYVFTALFMLYGALKSRSKSGLLSIVVLLVCPLLLMLLFQNNQFFPITEYGKKAYYGNGDGFWDLNLELLNRFTSVEIPMLKDSITGQQLYYNTGEPAFDKTEKLLPVVFSSKQGILLMRFIAFAYTYHYLNWFSKTEIIRWHKVPKVRFFAVIVLWLGALVTYAIDYALGLKVLFFLSFCHVLLEFPLNWVSIVGIFKETKLIAKNGFSTAVK
jgi:hypothetical protein